MSLRIGIDTSTLRFRHTGIANYTRELVRELQGAIDPHETLVGFDGIRFSPLSTSWCSDMTEANELRSAAQGDGTPVLRQGFESFVRGGLRRRLLARFVKEQLFAMGQSSFDLFHATVTVPPGKTDKTVIALIHDVSILRYPHTHPTERVRVFERWLATLSEARAVNTVSSFSKAEIGATLGIPGERIVVTVPGVDPFFRSSDASHDADALRGLELDERAIILIVGSIEPRKNISAALVAFSMLPPSVRAKAILLVVGGYGWGELNISPDVATLIASGSIRFTGYVSRFTLRALYRRAALLVFPSLYEGFGLPAAEAMACGTAVAVSRGTSLEAVVGPHGKLVASGDIEGWRDRMMEAVEAPDNHPADRARRQTWALKFDWRKNAATTLAMYRAVATGTALPADLM